MEFRRIPDLPPYVFAAVDEIKRELRRAGEDVIDLGFGNPDLPSPPVVVDKLVEAAYIPRNHRYSSSRGIPRLRLAICERYERLWGVRLDPETQAVTTIGAKEGLAHLLWTLVEPGDAALVPSPSYPIHIHAPILAGASVTSVSQATRAAGSCARIESRIESEIWSAILSGCPSVTDSDVKR